MTNDELLLWCKERINSLWEIPGLDAKIERVDLMGAASVISRTPQGSGVSNNAYKRIEKWRAGPSGALAFMRSFNGLPEFVSRM